ncbi:tetratricopeptide repeat protein [Tellurirhabdus rosea]|uniref:tetratricopeptide repeat protein n=1 Tax=Tellurirhabdus rosea TaxID=2674997 RepID=UPI002255362F|nr:tetratricopeptide repeat protein [Tellurirhabdus rosea]
MNNQRIQLLLSYIQEEPDEPFNVYALAMEYLDSQPAQAQHYFEMLLERFPHYLPTYYHAAALYAELENRPRAALLYEQGIALARSQQNQKAIDELSRAFRTFQEDDW